MLKCSFHCHAEMAMHLYNCYIQLKNLKCITCIYLQERNKFQKLFSTVSVYMPMCYRFSLVLSLSFSLSLSLYIYKFTMHVIISLLSGELAADAWHDKLFRIDSQPSAGHLHVLFYFLCRLIVYLSPPFFFRQVNNS